MKANEDGLLSNVLRWQVEDVPKMLLELKSFKTNNKDRMTYLSENYPHLNIAFLKHQKQQNQIEQLFN